MTPPRRFEASISKDHVLIGAADDQAVVADLAEQVSIEAAIHEGLITTSGRPASCGAAS